MLLWAHSYYPSKHFLMTVTHTVSIICIRRTSGGMPTSTVTLAEAPTEQTEKNTSSLHLPLLPLHFSGQWERRRRFDGEVVGEGGMVGGHAASPGAACWSEVTQLVARWPVRGTLWSVSGCHSNRLWQQGSRHSCASLPQPETQGSCRRGQERVCCEAATNWGGAHSVCKITFYSFKIS